MTTISNPAGVLDEDLMHDLMRELALSCEFLLGNLEPGLNCGRFIGSPGLEPSTKRGELGRGDENLNRSGHRRPDLPGALKFYLEDHRVTLHQSAFNFRAQRPVTVVAVAGVFEKLTGLHSPLKVFRGQEVVLDSVT